MNYIYETEGKTRAEAEKKALEVLGVTGDDVKFETVGASRGILGFVSRKPVRVRVYPKSDGLPGEAAIKGVLLTIVEKMGVDAEISKEGKVDGNHYVELASEDSGFLIGKHGRTLDALQFLVNLIVDSRMRKGKRVMLDVESYRKKREEALNRLASSVADRVGRNGRSVLLNYMNPYERRIVHLALEEDSRVMTKSEGEGVYKRVRIVRTRKGGGSQERDYDQQPEKGGGSQEGDYDQQPEDDGSYDEE